MNNEVSTGWYYVDGKGVDHGPYNSLELKGVVNYDTLVWRSGLADWTKARNTELRSVLSIRPEHPSRNGSRKFTVYASSFLAIFSFNGRATRGEWWAVTFISFAVAVGFVGYFVARMLTGDDFGNAVSGILMLALTWLIMGLLTLGVDVRRLHDTNKSGWLLLLFWLCGSVPLLNFAIGVIKFYMLGVQDGTVGMNNYGADPKGRVAPKAIQVVNTVVAASKEKDVATRLSELDKLREQGAISHPEYVAGRNRILLDV